MIATAQLDAHPAGTGVGAPGRILVADDIAENRALIRDLLAHEPYTIDEAADGLDALERVALQPPDVVLLDLQMPRMDGFEACRRLKGNPSTAGIPVLLVTALHDREHRLAGIGAGANDFITKPIDGTDLALRVRNALHMHRMLMELHHRYDELQRLERLRDDLVHMLVHDLRSPLSALSLTLQVAAADLEEDSLLREDVLEAARCTRDITDMVSDVLDTSRMEAGEIPLESAPVDLGELCELAARRVAGPEPGRVALELTSGRKVMGFGDSKILFRVVTNLVDNALKYHRQGEPVRVSVSRRDARVRVSVSDRGAGIPAERRSKIFDKFEQVTGPGGSRRSTGLGLAFCRLAVQAHHGRIDVEDREGGGSTFWFEIGAARPDQGAER